MTESPTRRSSGRGAVLLVSLIAACSPGLPGLGPAPATAPSPGARWTPPPSDDRPIRADAPPPVEWQSRLQQLTAADFVTLALERNPRTTASWAAARAAAATYGAARGDYAPTIAGDLGLNRVQTAATQGRQSVTQTLYGPSVSLNWLLFDIGGRSGAIGAARANLLDADWTHNAVLADVARQTEQAYFDLVGARALVQANRLSHEQAVANLSAAEERRRVGVATISDVLQSRTAAAQALLALQAAEGAFAAARGTLATLAGLAPTTAFDVDSAAVDAPVGEIGDVVDSLIAGALRERPDLAAARAEVEASRQAIGVARAQMLPSLVGTGTAARSYVSGTSGSRNSYNVGIGLSIPLFNGLSWQYAAEAARFRYDAATAGAKSLEQQAALQVYVAYQQLRTATVQVRAADELLGTATQAAEAARARYREGVGTVLELLSAESALADARAQRIRARVDWRTSLVQLAHDAGRLDARGAHLSVTPAPDSR